MADDPIWDEYEKGSSAKGKPFTVVGGTSDLVFRSARMPAPETIPPRPWLYGTQLMRGAVTVLVAPGGVGKTGYAMAVGLCLVTGRNLLGEHIFASVNVAIVNLEETMDELDRRLAALMIQHDVSRLELEGKYFLYSGDEGRLVIAAPSPDGFEIVHPHAEAIIREIQAHSIGLLVVDPFAESHELEENSNPQMIEAAGAWRRIARATGCAVLLIHHVRKSSGKESSTNIEAARGAKSLTDSARVGLLLRPMTEEEAELFGIDPDDRTSHICLDDAKTNMSRKGLAAKWLHLTSVELHNVTKLYPSGDRVAAIERWKPPGAMDDLTIAQCNEALDAIDVGPRPGVRYATHRNAKPGRWAGQVLLDLFSIAEERAASIIKLWEKSGVLENRTYDDQEQRKPRVGVFVNPLKRPGNAFG